MDGRVTRPPEKKAEKSVDLTGPADVLPFRSDDADFSWQREQILKSLQAKWAPRLITFAATFASVSREDAEDIVQAAFISLWNNRINDPGTPADAPFHAYLLRQVESRAIDHHRNRRTLLERFNQALSDRLDFASRWMNPADHLDQDGLGRTIKRAIDQMTPKSREIHILHYQADLTVDEIASTLGISRNTVRSFIKSGNAILREHLSRAGFGSGRYRGTRRQVTS